MSVKRTMRVIGDNLLVMPIEREDTTDGGIVLPDKARDQGICRAEVLQVGEGAWQNGSYKPPQCRRGDIVWFQRGLPGNEAMICEVKIDDMDLLVVSEQIVQIVETPANA